MNRFARSWARGAAAISLMVVLAACANRSEPTRALAMLADREVEPSRRVRAIDQSRGGDENARTALLDAIAWDDRQPTDLRHAAMAELIAIDESAFVGAAAQKLSRVERWETIGHVLDLAVARQWTALTPAIVQSWARASKLYADAQRPEREAIAALHPSAAVDDVLWATLADDALPSAAAAWTVLYRTLGREALIARLETLDPTTPLIADLQAGWRDLHILPRNREQIAWLVHFRAEPTFWSEATAAVRSLAPEQRAGLALRHIPVLTQAREGEPVEGGPFEPLSWPDRLLISFIMDRVHESIDAWFEQADADLADAHSEHGGLLTFDSRPGPRPFPPMIRGNDHKYVPPPELITAMYDGLAHYHFHAQKPDNGEFAMPGGGDLAFADRFGAACLVFTFIDRDTLNVDYYHEGGVVIDLGCIARPAKRHDH